MIVHLLRAISALEETKGDSFARAKTQFGSCTPDQMQEEYGLSGLTRSEVLVAYESREGRIDAAIDYLRGLAALEAAKEWPRDDE